MLPRSRYARLGAVATAAVIAVAISAVAAPRIAAADGIGLRFDAFAEVSPYALVGVGTDGEGPDIGPNVQLGAGGAAAVRFGRYFDLGLGLQYNLAHDDSATLHLGTVPVTAALVIPLGPTRELRVTAGMGFGLGRFSDSSEGGPGLRVRAGGGAVALAFVQRLREGGPDLLVEAGLRLDVLPVQNAPPSSSLDGGDLLHIQLPFVRIGATWR